MHRAAHVAKGSVICSLREAQREEQNWELIMIVLLLALIFAGLGFVVHLLWIVAVILFVCWVVGFALGRGRKSANA